MLNSSFYVVKIGKNFRRGCKKPSYTIAPSYSFSHKFSFKIVPHIALLRTKPPKKRNHFLKKKIMPQTRLELPTSLQWNHVNFRIGWSNCWKLSQIKIVICMVFLKKTNKERHIYPSNVMTVYLKNMI